MKFPGIGTQQTQHPLYVADGTIGTGGTAQLVLSKSQARSFLKLQNLSAGPLYFEFGSARATCSITSGKVTSAAISNAGFGFSRAPIVRFLGGGSAGNSSYKGLAQPNGAAPSQPAQGIAVMTGSSPNQSVASISISDPGSGYVRAPFVMLWNDDLDPDGCALPSATSGMLLGAQSSPYILNGSCCTTDAIAVYGATTGQAFLCRWMD